MNFPLSISKNVPTGTHKTSRRRGHGALLPRDYKILQSLARVRGKWTYEKTRKIVYKLMERLEQGTPEEQHIMVAARLNEYLKRIPESPRERRKMGVNIRLNAILECKTPKATADLVFSAASTLPNPYPEPAKQ